MSLRERQGTHTEPIKFMFREPHRTFQTGGGGGGGVLWRRSFRTATDGPSLTKEQAASRILQRATASVKKTSVQTCQG